MRTFIAIDLPSETKEYLCRLQEELKPAGADVKWVPPQNIHLTLKFLGELNDKKLPKIENALEEAAGKTSGFSIAVYGLGAFPSLDHPRIIWVGIIKGNAEVSKLAAELEERIAVQAGIPKEKRPFSAHITLGRLRSGKNQQGLSRELKRLNHSPLPCPGEFKVSGIKLYKSTLTPRGALYETLKLSLLITDVQ
jgi:2'-5' RNA ligase